jgi:hypothetical protein
VIEDADEVFKELNFFCSFFASSNYQANDVGDNGHVDLEVLFTALPQ